jgi:hypothetical protein
MERKDHAELHTRPRLRDLKDAVDYFFELVSLGDEVANKLFTEQVELLNGYRESKRRIDEILKKLINKVQTKGKGDFSQDSVVRLLGNLKSDIESALRAQEELIIKKEQQIIEYVRSKRH